MAREEATLLPAGSHVIDVELLTVPLEVPKFSLKVIRRDDAQRLLERQKTQHSASVAPGLMWSISLAETATTMLPMCAGTFVGAFSPLALPGSVAQLLISGGLTLSVGSLSQVYLLRRLRLPLAEYLKSFVNVSPRAANIFAWEEVLPYLRFNGVEHGGMQESTEHRQAEAALLKHLENQGCTEPVRQITFGGEGYDVTASALPTPFNIWPADGTRGFDTHGSARLVNYEQLSAALAALRPISLTPKSADFLRDHLAIIYLASQQQRLDVAMEDLDAQQERLEAPAVERAPPEQFLLGAPAVPAARDSLEVYKARQEALAKQRDAWEFKKVFESPTQAVMP